MKLHPSQLRAARLAAAEVFIAEGLSGTNWEGNEDAFRRAFASTLPWVRYGQAPRVVDVLVEERRGKVRVVLAPRLPSKFSLEHADEVAALVQRARDVARKVEAAIAKVADGSEA